MKTHLSKFICSSLCRLILWKPLKAFIHWAANAMITTRVVTFFGGLGDAILNILNPYLPRLHPGVSGRSFASQVVFRDGDLLRKDSIWDDPMG